MKSKNYYYLKVRKSTLTIVALILTLSLAVGLFINLRGFFGQETIITPLGEGITPTPTGIPAEEARKPLPNIGIASWYGTGEDECLGCRKFYDENGLYYLMSNKERLDDDKLTVAHKTLPLGTKVKFLRDEGDGSGLVVTVTVTDRGPYVEGRSWDFSKAVWSRLGGAGGGEMVVRWEVVE